MLNDQDLMALIKNIESDRIERTVSVNKTDKFCEAICAFSNDFPNSRLPGYLVIGVDDNGNSSNLTVSDQLLLNLGDIRSIGNILPLPAMTVQKRVLPDGFGEVAVVEVLPSDLPPVRYKGQVWIRVGPRRAIANETEERILSERRTAFAKIFDVTPCFESKLDDLSLDTFTITYRSNAVAADIISENHRDIKEQLASLRFYDLNRDCATFAGMILFGKEPLYWLPGAYVQFLRYEGDNQSSDVLTENRFTGDLLTLLREMDSFLPLQIQNKPVEESSLRETLAHDYPIVALRELLMNAIMHRSYESNAPIRFYWFRDHVEIQNPGGLYGNATPENFPSQNDYRNPIISEAMKTLGYVNGYGRGVIRAQEALVKNGNPSAEFAFQPSYVLVTLREKP
jgi:ATP-dependent DNA helicase RecG